MKVGDCANINPNPIFTPSEGTPTAAPAYFPYDHISVAEGDKIIFNYAKSLHMLDCKKAKRLKQPRPFFDRSRYVHLAMNEFVY